MLLPARYETYLFECLLYVFKIQYAESLLPTGIGGQLNVVAVVVVFFFLMVGFHCHL